MTATIYLMLTLSHRTATNDTTVTQDSNRKGKNAFSSLLDFGIALLVCGSVSSANDDGDHRLSSGRYIGRYRAPSSMQSMRMTPDADLHLAAH